MVVQRISTPAVFNSTITDVLRVQQRINVTQDQISSGFKTNVYQGLPGEVEALTAIDNDLATIEQITNNNSISNARITLVNNAINNTIDFIAEARNLLITAKTGTTGSGFNLTAQLDSLWKNIASQLNVTSEGRYLLGGDATNAPPAITSIPTLFGDSGAVESGYYQGSTQNVTYQIQKDLRITPDVRADDITFQKAYTAIALAIESDADGDDAKLDQAIDLLSQSLEDSSSVQVAAASAARSIEDATDRLTTESTYLQGVRQSIVSTDLITATTQVAADQTVLQAIFQVFARIQSLTIADFLRN